MNRTIVAGLLSVWLVLPTNVSVAEPELYDYVVKRGDTCVKIAKRELGSRGRYKTIHLHNPNMGRTPHRLRPGSILRLPKKKLTPDAHVTDKQGSVRVRPPAKEKWQGASKGMALFRSWRVNSQAKSSAEVTFADKSAIQLRENTVVIVYGPSSRSAKRSGAYASLERGTLRTRLSEFDGKQPVVVDTPGSSAEFGQGSGLVSVDERGTARVANHGGSKVVVRSKARRSRSVRVATGMGSKVKVDKPPERPRPLPPAPTWLSSDRIGIAFSSTGGTLRGKWGPVAEAESYRVEIAIDPVARAVVASVVVPSSVNEFEATGLPAGDYYASVSAIDNDKFESIPSTRAPMTLAASEIRGGSHGEKGGELVAVAGSELNVALGIRCAEGSGARSATLAIVGSGPLRCADAKGNEIAVPIVSVVPVKVAIGGDAPLERGATNPVELALSAGGLPVGDLEALAEGVEIKSSKRKSDGILVLEVFVADDAPRQAMIRLAPSATPNLVIATVAIEIEKRTVPPPEPIVVPPPERLWRAGVFAGIESGDRSFGSAGGLEPSAFIGLHLGREASERLGVELEGSFGSATSRLEQEDLQVFGLRGQLRVDLVEKKDFSLHAAAGASGLVVRGDTTTSDFGGHYGAGFGLAVSRAMALRLDARHTLLRARASDGIANELAIQLGARLRF